MHDAINSPDHYTRGGIESIDFIEAKGLNFHRGNAVKYLARAGFKPPGDRAMEIEDLKKARWYIGAVRSGQQRYFGSPIHGGQPDQALSVLDGTRARVSLRARSLPDEISRCKFSLSSLDSLTIYFFFIPTSIQVLEVG